jgi:PEP-CTERM/exosortase A-associated glycosyltransferase
MGAATSSLRILHVLDHAPPLQSGYVVRSQNIFREQVRRGWQPVAVVSPKQEEHSKEAWQDSREIAGVRYYGTRKASAGVFPLEGELRLMYAISRRIREIAQIEKPAVIHAHSPILNAYPAVYAGRRLGIPVVYEIRAFWEDAMVDHGTTAEGSLRYRMVRGAETWIARRADHTTVLCQGIRADLHKRGVPLEKLTAIKNGVDVDGLAGGPPDQEFQRAWKLEGKKVVGFIGSFYRYEGLDLLVEAFARLAGSRPELVLLLLGGGEVEHEIREQADKLGLGDRVLLPGRITYDRVPGAYGLMDLLVFPRRSMRLTELTTPLKPLEAMAMRKAVIASDIGGHRELMGDRDTALLFPAGDSAALAGAIETLLKDDSRRTHLAENGRRWVVQEHSWEKTTAPYEAIYARLLARSASSMTPRRVTGVA